MKQIKFLDHTADIKFQSFGKTIEESFVNASEALKRSIVGEEDIKSKMRKDVEISANSIDNLIYKFLEEFLFLLDAEDFIFSKIEKIKIDEKKFKLKMEIKGDLSSNYKISNEVKAVTYNEMFVKFDEKTQNWICQVVLDV
jgi:SHS2 domain-containing protein